MSRISSYGTCFLCHKTFSKPGMSRHLESCKGGEVPADASFPQHQKDKIFRILVEDYPMSEYWMYLELPAQATLTDLDNFLRKTWLECCGHLSAFSIGGVS